MLIMHGNYYPSIRISTMYGIICITSQYQLFSVKQKNSSLTFNNKYTIRLLHSVLLITQRKVMTANRKLEHNNL